MVEGEREGGIEGGLKVGGERRKGEQEHVMGREECEWGGVIGREEGRGFRKFKKDFQESAYPKID